MSECGDFLRKCSRPIKQTFATWLLYRDGQSDHINVDEKKFSSGHILAVRP